MLIEITKSIPRRNIKKKKNSRCLSPYPGEEKTVLNMGKVPASFHNVVAFRKGKKIIKPF